MSTSAISHVASIHDPITNHKPSVPADPLPAAHQDTVSLSPESKKAAQVGDVDRDGDAR